MIIIIISKLNLEVDQGQELGHRSEGLTRVDPSQLMYKSGYYYSFKTQLEGRFKARFGSRVGSVNRS